MERKKFSGVAALKLLTVTALLVALVVPTASARTVRVACEPREGGTSTISGRVLDAQTQQPAEGVTVTATRVQGYSEHRLGAGNWEWDEYSAQAVTNADGDYTVEGLPSGAYELTFEGGYYGLAQWSDPESDEGLVKVADGQAVVGIDATLEATRGSIGGVASLDGTPKSDVRVTAYSLVDGEWSEVADTETGEDGSYRLFLEPGAYRLGFEGGECDRLTNGHEWEPALAPTFYPAATSLEDASDVSVVLQADASADAALAGNPHAVTITGTVKNAEGAPVAGAVVTPYFLKHEGYWKPVCDVRATTGDDGSYSLRLLAGTFRLKCWPNDAASAFAFYPSSTTVGGADDVTLEAGGTTAADFSLGRGATLTGTLTDQLGRGPKHNEHFHFTVLQQLEGEWTPVATYSSETSAYALGSLPAGTYRLRFGYGGRPWLQPFFYKQSPTLEQANDIVAVEGESVALDPAVYLGSAPSTLDGGCDHTKVKRGQSVKLKVTASAGEGPIASARINVYKSSGKSWTWLATGATNSGGRVTVSAKVNKTTTFKFVFKGKTRVKGSSDQIKVTVSK